MLSGARADHGRPLNFRAAFDAIGHGTLPHKLRAGSGVHTEDTLRRTSHSNTLQNMQTSVIGRELFASRGRPGGEVGLRGLSEARRRLVLNALGVETL